MIYTFNNRQYESEKVLLRALREAVTKNQRKFNKIKFEIDNIYQSINEIQNDDFSNVLFNDESILANVILNVFKMSYDNFYDVYINTSEHSALCIQKMKSSFDVQDVINCVNSDMKDDTENYLTLLSKSLEKNKTAFGSKVVREKALRIIEVMSKTVDIAINRNKSIAEIIDSKIKPINLFDDMIRYYM